MSSDQRRIATHGQVVAVTKLILSQESDGELARTPSDISKEVGCSAAKVKEIADSLGVALLKSRRRKSRGEYANWRIDVITRCLVELYQRCGEPVPGELTAVASKISRADAIARGLIKDINAQERV